MSAIGRAAAAVEPAAAEREHRAGTGRIGMMVFLASDAMSFAALLLAYAVLRAGAEAWPRAASQLGPGAVPLMAVATLLLVASSVTMQRAVGAARAGAQRPLVRWLVATLLLGLGFLGLQGREYLQLVGQGLGLTHSHFFGSFYVLTGFHGLHVLAGLVYLTVVLSHAADGRYTGPEGRGAGGVELAGLYWHFVDVVWLAVFALVYVL